MISNNPPLSVIKLSNITLWNGNWYSLLTRARDLGREARPDFEGVLNDLRRYDQDWSSKEVISLYVERNSV
jgi:hypothetical protein